MRKYGEENFYSELLEQVEVEDLNDRERYWIKYYDSYYNGYNSTLGGDQPYRINYDKVKELWDSGMCIVEIANNMGHSRSAISRILKDIINISDEEIKLRGNKTTRSVTDNQVLKLWNKGLTPHQIRQEIGSTDNTIKQILIENGINENDWKKRINNNNRGADDLQVLQLWNQGKCLTEIANELHITNTPTIRKQLLEQGVNI